MEIENARWQTRPDGRMRDGMVEPGGIVSSPDGKLWRVVSVDDEKVVLKKVRGSKSVEVKWAEWARGWELKFP
jgi:hypothetical protein